MRPTTNPSPQEVDITACSFGSPVVHKDSPPPPMNMPFNPMSFLKEWVDKMQMMHKHQPKRIVVESRADKSCNSEPKFNNSMLQLLLVAGNVDFASPVSFAVPQISIYMQAMLNILAQPLMVRATHTVNILTTCFSQVPADLAEQLSPVTTHKSCSTFPRTLHWHSCQLTTSIPLLTL